MKWSANVLSTVTSDTEPTIIIDFETRKYIFNVGENTSRAFIQNRPNWKRTKGIFLTSVGTQRAGGLCGLLLTLADASYRKTDVIGPQGLTHFIAATRKYLSRDYFAVTPTEVPIDPDTSGSSASSDAVYQDENITVFALPIIPLDLAKEPIPTTSSDVSETALRKSSPDTLKRKRTHSPFSPSKHPHISRGTGNEASTSTSTPSTEERKYPTIESLIKDPSFDPHTLQGATAHEWREFMVQHSFRTTGLTPHERSVQIASMKASADNGASTTEQGMGSSLEFTPAPQRIVHPRGHDSLLPTFSLPYRKVTNTLETKPTLAYIVVGPRIRGKFDAAKASALKIPYGPQRMELTKGNAITYTFMAPDGQGGRSMVERTVQPEEVVGPSESPSVVLILDVPTVDHIPSLTSSFTDSAFFAKFRSKRMEDILEYAVRVVFHQCGDGVLEDERYKTFMNGFGPGVYHVVASREHSNDPLTFTSAAFNQLRLSQLDPDIFRLPKCRTDVKKNLESIPGLPPSTLVMRPNARHQIRPVQPPIYDQISEEQVALQSSTPISLSDLAMKRFSEAKETVKEFSKTDFAASKPGSDVVITPLGTSSACPTRFRNVSSTLIQIPKWGKVLLDAGEGTWGQFVRNFGIDSGSSSAWEALRNLKCIFISHIHADHHVGLAKILSMRRSLDPSPSEPLYLVAHSGVFLYLHEYSDLEDLGLDDPSGNGVKCILSDALLPDKSDPPRTFGSRFHWLDVPKSYLLADDLCHTLGLESFATVGMTHTTKCHGAIMKHLDGWSIVFSGDTIPSERLIRAGKSATLLIHEASMADDEIQLAKAKKHSTFGQSVDVGRRMNAENILLTHFSARYPRMPPSGVPTPRTHNNTSREPILALAFDHASIAIGDMWKMNLYLPAIEQNFSDIEEGEDEIMHLG